LRRCVRATDSCVRVPTSWPQMAVLPAAVARLKRSDLGADSPALHGFRPPHNSCFARWAVRARAAGALGGRRPVPRWSCRQGWLVGLRSLLNALPASHEGRWITTEATTSGSDEFLAELTRRGDTCTWEPGTAVARRSSAPWDWASSSASSCLVASGAPTSCTWSYACGSPACRVPRAEVDRLLAQRPDLALHRIQRLSQRLVPHVSALTITVTWLASVDVCGRLLGLFDTLAVMHDGPRVVPCPLGQTRIAKRVGASRRW
jgi:CRP/FNR family transcriptional regulator, cyclic AMP receptor protein